MSVDIARLAAKYRKCPSLKILLANENSNDWFEFSSSDIRALAAYCLAHQEKLAPSISIARLKQLLIEVDLMEDTYNGLQDLIDEAEKEPSK